jgi:hypothetical protein
VDWERLLTKGSAAQLVTNLTVRGKNLAFASRLAEILQLDDLPHKVTWLDIKRTMTPAAVREIHEAVAVLWPNAQDLDRVLLSQQERQSALYIGDYQPRPLARAVARHALYSDTVLVVDPIHHPLSLRPAFNPVVNPDEHRANTLVALRSWWLLFPWIEADIVHVIHLPGDFDPALSLAGYESAEARSNASSELKAILKAETEEQLQNFAEYREHLELSLPDEEFERRFREYKPDVTSDEIAALFVEIRRRRDGHPFFVEPLPISGATGQFLSFGVGTNYDMAKLVAARTRAHLVTDQRYRWKEIELDRELSGTDQGKWSAFAKAFQAAPLRFLDTADLSLATKLRAEQRLADLRLFFRKVWNNVSAEDSFSEAVATDLAAELNDRVADAEATWDSLDHELLKWLSGEGIAATGAVISGHADLLPAALGFAGAAAANVIYSTVKRHSFTKHHPAAFFIGRR